VTCTRSQPRQPKGVPIGGQWREAVRPEGPGLVDEPVPGPKVVFTDGRFVWRGTPAERHLPKAAGLCWDPDGTCWWTTDPMAAAKLANFADAATKAAIDDAIAARSESLALSRASDADVDVPVPDGLALLPFQRAGVAYALGRKAALIADEMGLGKTPQSIAVANATKARNILVVCPLSVKVNWEREITRWSTADPPLSVGHATARQWPGTEVVVAHYDVLARHEDDLRSREWDMVVLDEAHYLKNPKAQRTQAIFGRRGLAPLEAGRKLVLTGTPIPNRPIELYGTLRWLAPDVAGGWQRYATRYCAGRQTRFGWDVSGASNLAELQDKLRSTVMVRRRKADVLTELPPKRRQVVPLDPADVEGASHALGAERDGIAQVAAALAEARVEAELAKASDDPAEYASAVERLHEAQHAEFSEMSRLRHETAVVKAPAVAAHVADLLESGEARVAVWAHHHDVVDILREHLKDYGVVKVTGETPQPERQAAVDAFQAADGPRVFVGSITAAGTGITLTAAQTAVFAELDWVPGNVSQAEDRHHRIGQAGSVVIQHVLLDGSLDAKLANTLLSKQEVADRVLDRQPDQPWAPPEPFAIPDAAHEAPPATAEAPPSRIEQLAARLGEADRALFHEGVRVLAASDWDRAAELNDAGFSKVDTALGHRLAELDSLTPKQAALAALLCQRYRRQLGELGERASQVVHEATPPAAS
jgi:SWI/SNF-related matrix-associated actin-dependent regulator 1 of chromatin subfamily A